MTDNENGLCQFLLAEKKVLISPDSQVVLDWDQASISFPDFIEQICHPNDHDRISELLQQVPARHHDGFHFRIVRGDGSIEYVRFNGELTLNGTCWWGTLEARFGGVTGIVSPCRHPGGSSPS